MEVLTTPSNFATHIGTAARYSVSLFLVKKHTVIMLLRNSSQLKLCNDTRLIVHKMMWNYVQVNILSGFGKSNTILIPRILVILTNASFKFKRLQVPLRMYFVMSSNKYQGQALKFVGLQCQRPYKFEALISCKLKNHAFHKADVM